MAMTAATAAGFFFAAITAGHPRLPVLTYFLFSGIYMRTTAASGAAAVSPASPDVPAGSRHTKYNEHYNYVIS